jgi:hypothetical protein
LWLLEQGSNLQALRHLINNHRRACIYGRKSKSGSTNFAGVLVIIDTRQR